MFQYLQFLLPLIKYAVHPFHLRAVHISHEGQMKPDRFSLKLHIVKKYLTFSIGRVTTLRVEPMYLSQRSGQNTGRRIRAGDGGFYFLRVQNGLWGLYLASRV